VLHLVSTLVLCVIAAGLWFRRRNHHMHLRLMLAAFAMDVVLVLYIEITRQAVEKVVTHVGPLLWFHASVSIAVLACYVAMILLGRPMLSGKFETRKLHFAVAIAFVVLRGLNYVTSFLVT
jgi:uncharacterized membrane protein YozB (DUF420 family)